MLRSETCDWENDNHLKDLTSMLNFSLCVYLTSHAISLSPFLLNIKQTRLFFLLFLVSYKVLYVLPGPGALP